MSTAQAGACGTASVERVTGDMVTRDEAISRLQKHQADLNRLGVERLYLFGSTARGDAGDDSDVDLFFDYPKGKFGLYELIDVKEYTAGILGRKTDIMTRDSFAQIAAAED